MGTDGRRSILAAPENSAARHRTTGPDRAAYFRKLDDPAGMIPPAAQKESPAGAEPVDRSQSPARHAGTRAPGSYDTAEMPLYRIEQFDEIVR
jgi:hypothetical protein